MTMTNPAAKIHGENWSARSIVRPPASETIGKVRMPPLVPPSGRFSAAADCSRWRPIRSPAPNATVNETKGSNRSISSSRGGAPFPEQRADQEERADGQEQDRGDHAHHLLRHRLLEERPSRDAEERHHHERG